MSPTRYRLGELVGGGKPEWVPGKRLSNFLRLSGRGDPSTVGTVTNLLREKRKRGSYERERPPWVLSRLGKGGEKKRAPPGPKKEPQRT